MKQLLCFIVGLLVMWGVGVVFMFFWRRRIPQFILAALVTPCMWGFREDKPWREALRVSEECPILALLLAFVSFWAAVVCIWVTFLIGCEVMHLVGF